jgi:hypothetical protein
LKVFSRRNPSNLNAAQALHSEEGSRERRHGDITPLSRARLHEYVDYIIEIGAVPPEGAILSWVCYRGEGSAIYTLPLGDGAGVLASYATDDPDEECSDLEPFVVIGT